MSKIYSSFDTYAINNYEEQEDYKSEYNIPSLYKSFNAPVIFDYEIKCFVTYFPNRLEWRKLKCNPKDILNKSKYTNYMRATMYGYTINNDDDANLTEYVKNYFINKFEYTDDVKLKKKISSLSDKEMNDTFYEIIDDEKKLRYKFITSFDKYIKNNTIIIKKSRYSPNMDYRHIQENLYVKKNNIIINIEE
jgi:hypothetical protein